jgi:N-acetylmuramoyl-L-alanine amidase
MKVIRLLIILLSLCSCHLEKEMNLYLNHVIFIDPGHGGKDNGTHYNDIFEDELNLKLAKILYEQIIDDGGICYLTRIADYDLSSMYSKNHKIEDLNKRIEFIHNSKATLFVSLHLNYYHSSNVNGMQVFYQKDNKNSRLLAEILQTKLNNQNKKNKNIKPGDYYILNNCKNDGVLIEYGFISNELDRKKLLDDKYLIQLSNLIKDGISEYLKEIDKY